MLQAFHKLNPKPKTIPELIGALQQIWDDLPQTTINKATYDFRKRLNACVVDILDIIYELINKYFD